MDQNQLMTILKFPFAVFYRTKINHRKSSSIINSIGGGSIVMMEIPTVHLLVRNAQARNTIKVSCENRLIKSDHINLCGLNIFKISIGLTG